ncbi:MAG: integrase family protein [Rickettsiales bacterium]|nr:integrase family protein [Rickettsiales bacterium]
MPSVKLTKRAIDDIALAEHGKQKFYWDTELRGFGLRVGSASKTFIVQKDMNGKSKRASIGRYGTWTLEEARKEAREHLVQMDKGVDVAAEKRKVAAESITLVEAWALHKEAMKRKNASPNTIDDYERAVNTHLSKWKNRNLADITRAEVKETHSTIGKTGGYGANGMMRCFRAIYNTAMKDNEFLPPNPCIAVQWFKEYRRQEPVPESKMKDWYKTVLTIPNGARRDYHLFVMFTGLRRSDACTVKWADIDMDAETLHRPNPKGGKERAFTIPLPDVCIEILARRREENEILYGKRCPWVFATKNRQGEVIPMQEPKENKRGLPSPHRLRDTYTTACNTAGLSAYDIEVLTNHRPANNSVTAGYISQGVEHLRDQQQKVADYLKERMGI